MFTCAFTSNVKLEIVNASGIYPYPSVAGRTSAATGSHWGPFSLTHPSTLYCALVLETTLREPKRGRGIHGQESTRRSGIWAVSRRRARIIMKNLADFLLDFIEISFGTSAARSGAASERQRENPI